MTDIAPRQRNANWHCQSKIRGQHNFSSPGASFPFTLNKTWQDGLPVSMQHEDLLQSNLWHAVWKWGKGEVDDEMQLNTWNRADLQNFCSLLIWQRHSMKMEVTKISDFYGIHPCLSLMPLIFRIFPISYDYRHSIGQDMAYLIEQNLFSETGMNLSLPRCSQVWQMLVLLVYFK